VSRNFIAFDIETAKDIPGAGFNWRPNRPLGICCIASMSDSCNNARVWFSKGAKDVPLGQMTSADVADFVNYLETQIDVGFTPITWNGVGFDYDILAEESALFEQCKRQALLHCDLMFHVVCEKGFPVSLANACSGMGLPGKLRGVEGRDAPKLWQNGDHERVCEYVAQDVRAVLGLATECERQKTFRWRTGRGSVSSFGLPRGWLSVSDALQLPLPDTSWMSNPISRDSYVAWLGK
jgi:hypothetical protein